MFRHRRYPFGKGVVNITRCTDIRVEFYKRKYSMYHQCFQIFRKLSCCSQRSMRMPIKEHGRQPVNGMLRLTRIETIVTKIFSNRRIKKCIVRVVCKCLSTGELTSTCIYSAKYYIVAGQAIV